MSWAARLARAVWAFVVGDDWVTAAGVAVALAVTAVVADAHASAWWIMPVAVIVLLGRSVHRAAR